MITWSSIGQIEAPDSSSVLTDVTGWLADSGCTLQEGPYAGGVRHYYDWLAHRWGNLYNEITGYAVSLWVRLYGYTGLERYLHLAEQSAAYLRSIQVQNGPTRGAVPLGLDPETGQTIPECYTFDTAICVAGWADLCAATGNYEWQECIERGLSWLLTLQATEGLFRARVHLNGESLASELGFAGDGGCLHGKHTLALLRSNRLCPHPEWQQAAIKVADWVLGLQAEDGAFWANAERRYVFTHAHCYALEGLLFAAAELGREDYHRAAVRGARWLAQVQLPDGSLARFYKVRRPGRAWLERWNPVRALDATAQAVRIWRVLAEREEGDFREHADRAWAFLTAQQWQEHPDPAVRGAFPYQLRGRWKAPRIHTWVNQFALSAGWMSQPGQKGSVEDLF